MSKIAASKKTTAAAATKTMTYVGSVVKTGNMTQPRLFNDMEGKYGKHDVCFAAIGVHEGDNTSFVNFSMSGKSARDLAVVPKGQYVELAGEMFKETSTVNGKTYERMVVQNARVRVISTASRVRF